MVKKCVGLRGLNLSCSISSNLTPDLQGTHRQYANFYVGKEQANGFVPEPII